jgi:tRNA G10  N-methylase Trm11
MNTKNLYAFTLGREWKVSLAELMAIFGTESYQSHTETIALFQIVGYSTEQLQKKFLTIGGSIRIIEILGDSSIATFPTDVIEYMRGAKWTGKIDFALGSYGTEFRLSDIGLRIKKTMQDSGTSIRLANIKNENINAASFKKEKLSKTGHEYNLIIVGSDGYIGRTLACQDIDSYAKRDTAKSRDMITWMMPPKLVQMMINIATAWENITNKTNPVSIYDPFCGLGTTLIEAANMGISQVYGSDLSPEMVRSTESSLSEYIAEEKVWQERIIKVGGTPNKNFANFQSKIIQLDARDVATAKTKLAIPSIPFTDITIVSEWYLGEIMRPHEITLDKAKEERRKLERMYNDFFAGLSKAKFCKSIVMTFPFWNLNGTYSYFIEIYDILDKHGFEVISLLPWEMKLNTMKWSLLYRRENQTVWREIVKIVPKK